MEIRIWVVKLHEGKGFALSYALIFFISNQFISN